MAITASSTGCSTYEPVPVGNYIARCFSMVHIGTIMDTYKGETRLYNKVRITWELPTETKSFKDGEPERPYTIGQEFTLSLSSKSHLRKFLESWRGKPFTEDEAKGFDIEALLDKPCMLNVIHKVSKTSGKSYAEIASVSPMMKGIACPERVNNLFVFSYDPFEQWRFDELPEWLREKVKTSIEYQAHITPSHTEAAPAANEISDDLPF